MGGPVLDGAPGSAVRLFADEHRPDRRRGLKTGGGVDDVARDEGLPALGAGVECHDRLARVDGHAKLEPFLFGPVADGERRAHGPLGVVSERHRGTEDAHDGIPDELLDPAAVALELISDTLVVRDQEGPDILGIELLGAGREAHEVDEQDRDEAPLLARPVRRDDRSPAGVAELRAGGVLLSTARTGEHESEH